MISPGSGARGGAAPENKKQYSFADESEISSWTEFCPGSLPIQLQVMLIGLVDFVLLQL